MTSIKPPEGPGGAPPAAAPDAPSAPSAADAPDAAPGTVAESAPAAQGVEADAIAELASQVQAGALGVDQAIERLVDRALASVSHRLSDAQQTALTEVLRSALQDDPTLAALRRDMG